VLDHKLSFWKKLSFLLTLCERPWETKFLEET